MNTMTIGKKVSLACAALVALTIILGTVTALKSGSVNTDVRALVNGPLPSIYSIGLIQANVREQKIAMLQHILAETPEQKSRMESAIADLEDKLKIPMATLERTISTPQSREQFDQLKPLHEHYNRVWATIQPLSRDLKTKEAMAIWYGEAHSVDNERAKLLADIAERRSYMGGVRGNKAIATSDSVTFWSLLILGFSIVSGGLLAYFIIRGINKALAHAVTDLSESAEQVSSASGQVSGSSQALAQGASEQAASLEETSASSEEMSSMTRKNAENSQQSAHHMNVVSQRVAEANTTLDGMMLSMQEIGASSNKISKIIKVIDEIAFQTNILALNAAVEAARAGEAGMGFAVVADEVRNLAQRSAQAAKDTAALIEDSILKSGEGSKRLAEVATSIRAITEGAEKVKTLVDEVDASSKEQAQGIEQIAKAVAQMDQVTQKTAANAEESASASEELNAQSQALMAVVQQLQALVGTSSAGARKSVAAKRPPVARSGRSTPRPQSAKAFAPKPALAGTTPRAGAEFPLDDSEFREF